MVSSCSLWPLLWACLWTTWLSGASAQCPAIAAPCICAPSVYEPVGIVCDNAGSIQNVVRAINSARDIQIDSLVITNTPTPRLNAFAFQGFTIIRLVINGAQLQQIDPQAFDGPLLESLLELDLKNNNLNQIPQTGVPSLKSLRKLYLSGNNINNLPPNAFQSYASKDFLLKLDLAGNKLADLGSTTAFNSLRSLEELSLENNLLTRVPTQALRVQKNTLTDLNLGLNSINNIPTGALSFPELKSLSLEFNGIQRLPGESLRGVPKLLYLYLTGNKFPAWDPNMFQFVPNLQNLGIGETPIRTIPANAFRSIPRLVRLEMTEAAVDTIQPGAFQTTPNIQAIILNRNRISRVREDMFKNLQQLQSLDLQGNQLETVENRAFSNLPSLRHLDISSNLLQTLDEGTFQGTFLPQSSSEVSLYICDNPWVCDQRLMWFRLWLNQPENAAFIIDKPGYNNGGCNSYCTAPSYFPPNWPIKQLPDPVPPTQPPPKQQDALRVARTNIGWIILAVILAILLTAICLLALVRYLISRRRKQDKDEEEDEKIISSAASAYGPASIAPVPIQSYTAPPLSIQYPTPANPYPPVDIDLPPANTLDANYSYWQY